MNNIEEIKERIRAYILSEFLPGESADNLKDDTPLLTSGVLESLSTVKLASFVEDSYNIELAAYETGVRDFDRIQDIAALVVRKQAGG